MRTPSFLARLEAAPGAEEAVEKLLAEAADAADITEDGAWWALRFGAGEHAVLTVGAPPATDVLEQDRSLLDGDVVVEPLEVLAQKLHPKRQVGKALVLRLPVRSSNEAEATEALAAATSIVERELETVAWLALRFPDGDLGVVCGFPDRHARRAHLNGRFARDVGKRLFGMLDGFPSVEPADVLVQRRPASSR